MLRPICVECQTEYRCKKNGVAVYIGSEMFYDADLYECPNCNRNIVTGFGSEPYRSEWMHKQMLRGSDLVVADLSGENEDSATQEACQRGYF
jgi:hypothetical protein